MTAKKKTVSKLRAAHRRTEDPATIQCAFRLTPEMVERLDRHAIRLRDKHPGAMFSRSDVVRLFMVKGLDEAERRHMANDGKEAAR